MFFIFFLFNRLLRGFIDFLMVELNFKVFNLLFSKLDLSFYNKNEGFYYFKWFNLFVLIL